MSLIPTHRAARLVERNWVASRHYRGVVISGFFEPLFYLLSIGVGIGALVGDVAGPGGEPVDYRTFVAPGLLAASAMNGAVYDATMNFFYKLKYIKAYDAALATPIGVGDVAYGELTWSIIRGLVYAVGFLVVMAALGLIHSFWALLALPAAALIGVAFAAIGFSYTTFMRSWTDFDGVQLGVTVLFLFSATFYPLSTYSRPIQILVQLTPLYHGVELMRDLTFGVVGAATLGHVAYLAAVGAIGLAVTSRRLARLLLQ